MKTIVLDDADYARMQDAASLLGFESEGEALLYLIEVVEKAAEKARKELQQEMRKEVSRK